MSKLREGSIEKTVKEPKEMKRKLRTYNLEL